VASVEKNMSGKWIINGNKAGYGLFDGVAVAVGVCGDLVVPCLPGHENLKGSTFYSSNLDGKEV
jgi:hypothetical protein